MNNNLSFTFGFCTRDDSDGAWMTINGLLEYHLDIIKDSFELIVIDNSPEGSIHAKKLAEYVSNIKEVRYIRAIGPESSCLYKERLFREAKNDVVVCCDSHVLFSKGSIYSLIKWFNENPNSNDLISGPCLHRSNTILGTNQMIHENEPYDIPQNADVQNGYVWRGGALGVWVVDPRGVDVNSPPFEIMQQGTGAFAMRRLSWPGFHKDFIGHGGNETFLMERVRQEGGKVFCLPSFRWIHKFLRVNGAPYSLSWDHRVTNYLTGFSFLDNEQLYNSAVAHLTKQCPQTVKKISNIIKFPENTINQLRKKLETTEKQIPGQIPDDLFNLIKESIRPGLITLEFGSGLSTLLFDKKATNHTSIEHDAFWHKKVSEKLSSKTIALLYSPIDENDKWYKWRPKEGYQCDLLLIDGPPGKHFKREGCLHYLADIMSPTSTILIDDTHRPNDLKLSNDIANMYGYKREHFTSGNRAFDRLTRVADKKIYEEGVGTELKNILSSRWGMTSQSSCGCNGRIREMNYRGINWCENNIDIIVQWLLIGANKWIATHSGGIGKWIDIVPNFAKRGYIKSLVQESIQLAKKKPNHF